MRRNVCLADCGALDKVLGQKDAPKFGVGLWGKPTPVLKKVPAFLLFLAFYLAIVISMATVFFASSSASVQAKFTDIGDGFWRGNDLDDWFPNASLAQSGVDFASCRGRCLNNNAGCKGFRVVKRTTAFSETENCYISITSLSPKPETCDSPCNSYVRSLSDPTPQQNTSAGFNSPLAPENLGCSQPLSFGLLLCIMVSSGVFVVYWPFFTLTVPARIGFLFLFGVTMFVSAICGIMIADWVSKEEVCTVPLFAFDDPRTPAQRALASAAKAAAACLILMGAWPLLIGFWVAAYVVQVPFIHIYCAMTGADTHKTGEYIFRLKWLIWQDYEYGGAPPGAAGPVHPTPTAQQNNEMVAMSMDVTPATYPPGFLAVAPPAGAAPPSGQVYQGVPPANPLNPQQYHPANPPYNNNLSSPYNGNPSPCNDNPPPPYDHPAPSSNNVYNDPSPYNNGNPYPSPVVMPPNYPSHDNNNNNNNNSGGDYGPHNNYGDNNNGHPAESSSYVPSYY